MALSVGLQKRGLGVVAIVGGVRPSEIQGSLILGLCWACAGAEMMDWVGVGG